MDAYLPYIVAIGVALVAALANYFVGNLKNKVDTKSLINNANEALRDDLLGLVDRYETREKQLVARNDENTQQNERLQTTITTLRLEINSLRIENQDLKAEVQKLRSELHQFDSKVYYKRDSQAGEK